MPRPLAAARPSRRARPGTDGDPARAPVTSVRRVVQFAGGLALCAVGVWMSLQAGLGLSPWDVLHSGLSGRAGVPFAAVLVAVGVAVLGLSAALGVRARWGTLVNVLAVGFAIDRLLASTWLDEVASGPVPTRVVVLVGAVVLLGAGAALYIGAGFGAGPRDSLMVACHRHGLPIGLSRCAIELTVLGTGWLLGGAVGVGTVVLALGLGPMTQVAFRVLRQDPSSGQQRTG